MSARSGPAGLMVAPIRSSSLEAVTGLVHGFSTRIGGVSTAYRKGTANDSGDLNLGYTEHDSAGNVRTNRLLWREALGVETSAFRYALLRQVHSSTINLIRDPADAADDFTEPGTLPADGLVTDCRGVMLTIQTADCIPVLLCDPVLRVIGAFHAGWRGTLARIVERGVDIMRELYGSNPEDIIAAIGPGVGPASYAVSEEVQEQFEAEFVYASGLFNKPQGEDSIFLDLWEANRQQLLRAGLQESNIDVLGLDTATDTSGFFSYRAEKGRTGRMMSSIGYQP